MSNQFNIVPTVKKVVNGLTLTATYQNSALIDTKTNNFLGLMIQYTKGDETGVQIKIEGTTDISLGLASTLATATWYQRVAESTTGGNTTITPDFFELKSTANVMETVYPCKLDGVKISVIADSLGSSPGTITVYAITSWV